MTTCSSDLITKGCMCLSNPVAPNSQLCAYVNRQNGLVTPCDEGCCVPACKYLEYAPNILQSYNEFRPSSGTALPAGFGVNLVQSDEPTQPKDAYDFTQPEIRTQAVWERMLVPLLMLVIVFLAIISMA